MAPLFKVFFVLACFALIHQLSVRENIKSAIRRKTGASLTTYAGIRALIALALLILSVVILFRNTEATGKLFSPRLGLPAILPAIVAFWIAGRALGQVAKAHRLPQFFGFQEYPRLFIFSGAYTICRHPMYTSWLIASWGILLSKPYLLTLFYNLLLTGYVVFAALSEERRMVELFGDKYRAYQKQIPSLLPYGCLIPAIRKEGVPKL